MQGMVLLLALACGQPTDSAVEAAIPAACASAPQVDWDNWGHGFFLTWCNACHAQASQNRSGAPEDVNFDTPAQVKHWEERIRVRVLEDGSMPLGGGVYPEDLDMLEVLLSCDF